MLIQLPVNRNVVLSWLSMQETNTFSRFRIFTWVFSKDSCLKRLLTERLHGFLKSFLNFVFYGGRASA